MNLIKTCLPKAALFFTFFLLLTGVAYTGFITVAAQIFFPFQANGSIVEIDGEKYSMLLGQTYTQDQYLWGRLQDYDFAISSRSPFNSNSDWIPHSHGEREILMYSWASNASPAGDADSEPQELNRTDDNEPVGGTTHEGLMRQRVAADIERIREANRRNGITDMDNVPIPVALVTNSGSGLDPHIPPAAAEYQVRRIAAARGMSEQQVRDIIAQNTTGRTFGLFGEPVVHVLKVNLMLDGVSADQLR